MTRHPVSLLRACCLAAALCLTFTVLAAGAGNAQRGNPPVLPPVRELAARSAANQEIAALERKVAALQVELEETRERELRLQGQLLGAQAAAEQLTTQLTRLQGDLQDHAEFRLSTRQAVILQLRREVADLELAAIREREDDERLRELREEQAGIRARLAELEAEEGLSADPARNEPPRALVAHEERIPRAQAAVRSVLSALRGR